MRILTLAVIGAAALVNGAPQAGAQSAYDYPWCAVRNDRSGAQSCYYASYGQCMQTISGIGGSCIRSPYYRGPHGRRDRRFD